MKQKERNANRDGGIRDIECRPMELPDIKVKKINDLSQAEAVDHVPDRTAVQEGNGDQAESLFLGRLPEKISEQEEGDDGDDSKKNTAETFIVLGEQAEGGTRISNIGQGEKAVNDSNGFMKTEGAINVKLADLIKEDDAPPDHAEKEELTPC